MQVCLCASIWVSSDVVVVCRLGVQWPPTEQGDFSARPPALTAANFDSLRRSRQLHVNHQKLSVQLLIYIYTHIHAKATPSLSDKLLNACKGKSRWSLNKLIVQSERATKSETF